MAMIVYQNPPQPRIPDALEQYLENRYLSAKTTLRQSLAYYGQLKMNGLLIFIQPFQHLTIMNYYHVNITFVLMFCHIPALLSWFLNRDYPYFVAFLVTSLIATEMFYFILEILFYYAFDIQLITLNHESSFYFSIFVMGYCYFGLQCLFAAHQWLRRFNALRQYQHGTRHRISILPKSVIGA